MNVLITITILEIKSNSTLKNEVLKTVTVTKWFEI